MISLMVLFSKACRPSIWLWSMLALGCIFGAVLMLSWDLASAEARFSLVWINLGVFDDLDLDTSFISLELEVTVEVTFGGSTLLDEEWSEKEELEIDVSGVDGDGLEVDDLEVDDLEVDVFRVDVFVVEVFWDLLDLASATI